MSAKATLAIKRRIKNAIYTALNAQRITSRIYRDENWQAVNNIISIARSIAGDAWATVENGGYKGTSKEYKLTVSTPDGVEVNGLITCFAAGTVADPFSAYDVTVMLF